MSKTPRTIALLLALGLLSACAVLEEFEITYGSGKYKLHPVKLQVLMPHMSDMEAMAAAESGPLGAIGGDIVSAATLAHLRGALRLTGECSFTGAARRENVEGEIDPEATLIALHDCDEARCPGHCPPEVTHGVLLDLSIRALVVSDRRARSIRDTLASVSPSAIRQFRLRMLRLAPYETWQNPDGTVEEQTTTDRFAGFSLAVAEPGGEPYPLLGWKDLQQIDPETPQRYDLPMETPVVQSVIRNLLVGEAIWIDLKVGLWLPEEELFDMLLAGSGIRIDLQPEMVLSVRDVAGAVL